MTINSPNGLGQTEITFEGLQNDVSLMTLSVLFRRYVLIRGEYRFRYSNHFLIQTLGM